MEEQGDINSSGSVTRLGNLAVVFSQEPGPQTGDVRGNRGSFHDGTGKKRKNRALRHHGSDDICVKGLKTAVRHSLPFLISGSLW